MKFLRLSRVLGRIPGIWWFFLGIFLFFLFYFSWIFLSLPRLLTMSDYRPPLLTEVYDRNDEKVGELFTQRRKLFKYEEMPAHLINAFVAAEDGSFFSHRGINYKAILRAALANFKAGKKIQGGSTITQQVARTLLLSSKKTYTRKLKEAILALRMEAALSKQDILYIYLNQIYLGHGAYGVETASRTYFRKSTKDLSLAEAALLAGLPKAPSRFSPVFNPERAKARQVYVLNRMLEEEYITEGTLQKVLALPVKIYLRRDFNSQSPYYLETARRVLLRHFEQEELLEGGLKIWVAMDLTKQFSARTALQEGLEALDRRRGFRGVETSLKEPEERAVFLKETTEKLKRELKTHLFLPPYRGAGGKSEDELEDVQKTLRTEKNEETEFSWEDARERMDGKILKAWISRVEEEQLTVRVPWGTETLKLKDLEWAVPVEEKPDQAFLSDLRKVFKVHDVISLRVVKRDSKEKKTKNSFLVELYQEPLVEGALISFDLESEGILALVGGYSYSRSQFNRAYQAVRQSGSVFKPFVYGAALERGFHPASVLSDMPVVFTPEEADDTKSPSEDQEKEGEEREIWKPSNISDRFTGDILFRSALIKSLNVPTVKVIEKTGIKWTRFYARRLGLFSPLNPDFTMALGSSALTLYETVKAFSVFGRLGRGITPRLILKVEDPDGNELLSNVSLDGEFKEKIEQSQARVQEEKIRWFPQEDSSDRGLRWKGVFEEDSSLLIPPQNSYVMTSLLSGVIEDVEGTARRAKILNRPLAGKTGTTDGYYDTWFVGYSPLISTGVWVGFDTEKTLGKGETGSRVALPVWMDYMKTAHKDLPVSDFPVPEDIVFANIDTETGGLASSDSNRVARQAFIEGTEPTQIKLKKTRDRFMESGRGQSSLEGDESFIREDLSN